MSDEFHSFKGKEQVRACLKVLKECLNIDLLGVYLYGSSVVGGLQRYSDLDLFAVSKRETTKSEKESLISHLLEVSGLYMKEKKRPIELTVIVQSQVNPWSYPPQFDFQYGEWLREDFENGVVEPWGSKSMPDLAVLITQVLLASETLYGNEPGKLLSQVPYRDFMQALSDSMQDLLENIKSDTRNALLTLARIWSTASTDTILSKIDAANWALNHLPDDYHPVLLRAKFICQGSQKEAWDDLLDSINPCAEFMFKNARAEVKSALESKDIRRIRIES